MPYNFLFSHLLISWYKILGVIFTLCFSDSSILDTKCCRNIMIINTTPIFPFFCFLRKTFYTYMLPIKNGKRVRWGWILHFPSLLDKTYHHSRYGDDNESLSLYYEKNLFRYLFPFTIFFPPNWFLFLIILIQSLVRLLHHNHYPLSIFPLIVVYI